MKFKEGDKVRVLDRCTTGGWASKVGKVSADRLFFNRLPVVFNDCAEKYFKEDDLELVTEEETSMKFKVGDKVKIVAHWSDNVGMIGEIEKDNYLGSLFKVVVNESKSGAYDDYDLELVTEEETSMKFKVGDKVKVSNSWGGHTGKVGEIIESNPEYKYKYPYCVKFEVGYDESFKEEELELVSEKDTYPSLKQEYRSLLEIQRELTVLEESMMRTVRHTRTEIARNYEELAELESKILDAAKQ